MDDGWEMLFSGPPSACRAWRDYCDWINLSLLKSYPLPSTGARKAKVLKTDLFEETQGSGLTGFFADCGADVFGIDVAEGAVCRISQTRKDVTPVRGNILRIPFRQESFDAVVSTSSLDHFRNAVDIETGLQSIREVLRPGGVLYLTMDNPTNPCVWLRRGYVLRVLRKLRIVPYFVGATLSAERLKSILEQRGFTSVATDYSMHFPRVIGVHLTGALSKMGMSRVQKAVSRLMKSFEMMPGRWLRKRTGHFSSLVAYRSDSSG